MNMSCAVEMWAIHFESLLLVTISRFSVAVAGLWQEQIEMRCNRMSRDGKECEIG